MIIITKNFILCPNKCLTYMIKWMNKWIIIIIINVSTTKNKKYITFIYIYITYTDFIYKFIIVSFIQYVFLNYFLWLMFLLLPNYLLIES